MLKKLITWMLDRILPRVFFVRVPNNHHIQYEIVENPTPVEPAYWESFLRDIPENLHEFFRPLLENLWKSLTQTNSLHDCNCNYNRAKKQMANIAPIMVEVVTNLRRNPLWGTEPMLGPVSQVTVLKSENKTIHLNREVVEAVTHRLSAQLSLEINFKEAFGGDLFKAIVHEITHEYEQHLFRYLRMVATEYESSNAGLIRLKDDLIQDICAAADLIRTKSHRGRGNVLLLSPLAASILDVTNEYTNFITLGNGYSFEIVIDPYANESVPAIVGYRGTTMADSGLMWCPYIPVVTHGAIVDPNTFEMVSQFMGRFGIYNNAASNYFVSVPVMSKELTDLMNEQNQLAAAALDLDDDQDTVDLNDPQD